MRVSVLTAGSRGDVQPYVALARGLQAAGHDVTFATHAPFGGFVAEHGLHFFPVAGDPRAFLAGESGLGLTQSGEDFGQYLRRMGEFARPLWRALLDDYRRACEGAEAIVFSPLAIVGYDLAEALGVPAMMTPIVPLTPSREVPMYLAPELPWGPAYCLATHAAVRTTVSALLKGPIDRWRHEALGLPPHGLGGPLSASRQARLPTVHGYSPMVIPRPADWPAHHQVAGYWFLEAPAAFAPPPALAAFLEAGPRPVYIGFGSMVTPDPAGVTATVLEAVRLAGCRAVVATGWGGLRPQEGGPDVHVIEGAPHDWLFPRMAAIVHHGGAGTTAAALRAGVPAVMTPFFSDQPFWARRVAALGVAPAPVPQARLNPERLAAAIRCAVTDAGMADRAARLGHRIRAEDGVGRAVAAFHALVEQPVRR